MSSCASGRSPAADTACCTHRRSAAVRSVLRLMLLRPSRRRRRCRSTVMVSATQTIAGELATRSTHCYAPVQSLACTNAHHVLLALHICLHDCCRSSPQGSVLHIGWHSPPYDPLGDDIFSTCWCAAAYRFEPRRMPTTRSHCPLTRPSRWLTGLPAACVATRRDCHRLAHHHSRLLPPHRCAAYSNLTHPAPPACPPEGHTSPFCDCVHCHAGPLCSEGGPPYRGPPHRGCRAERHLPSEAAAPWEGRRAEGGPPR